MSRNAARYIPQMGLFAVCAGMAFSCGKSKSNDDAVAPTAAPTTAVKTTGSAISLTGNLSIGTGGLLGLVGNGDALAVTKFSGTIKCTYAKETEDKATVTNGDFTLGCKSGVPMVVSAFNSDGDPVCTFKFIVNTKSVGTANLYQDISFGALNCVDGEAAPNLDKLAPETAAKNELKKTAEGTVVNAEDDHWAFTIDKVVEIGIDGTKNTTKKTTSKRGASTALNLGGTPAPGNNNNGPSAGSVINLAFYDTDENGAKLADGKITVAHFADDESGWEFIPNADLVWSGAGFTATIQETKDVAKEIAEKGIMNQRGPNEMQQTDYSKMNCDPSKGSCGGPTSSAPSGGSMSGPSYPGSGPRLVDGTTATPPPMTGGPTGVPDTFDKYARYPVEAVCQSTKWKATAPFTDVCTKMANMEFVDFYMEVCKQLPVDMGDGIATIGRTNLFQCQGTVTGGYSMPMPPTPKPGEKPWLNAGDYQGSCTNPDSQFLKPFNDNFMNGFKDPVNNIERQIMEINYMAKIAANDADLAPLKKELDTLLVTLKAKLTDVKAYLSNMQTAMGDIESAHKKYCGDLAAAETQQAAMQVQQNRPNDQALFAKLDGSKMQQYFDPLFRLIQEKFYNNPKLNQLRSMFISAPNMQIGSQTPCELPANAKKYIKYDFLKPGGECTIKSDITISGNFSDAKTIKPMSIKMMDRLANCALTIKEIAFDETTGCWTYGTDTDATTGEILPKLNTKSVDASGLMGGGYLQRILMTGSAVKETDN